jgi:hypothetical protein
MIQTADIREWRNHNVIDPKGHKIGAPEEIYVDTTAEDRPWPRSGPDSLPSPRSTSQGTVTSTRTTPTSGLGLGPESTSIPGLLTGAGIRRSLTSAA